MLDPKPSAIASEERDVSSNHRPEESEPTDFICTESCFKSMSRLYPHESDRRWHKARGQVSDLIETIASSN
jgi:hypothetical protein